MIILPVIFGFLSGLIGCLVFGSSGLSVPFWRSIDFSDQTIDGDQLVIDQPRNVVVSQDLRLKQIENELFPALANIYPADKSANVLSQLYLPNELLGQGFVLTADGWVVTVSGAITNIKGDYQVVDYQLKEYKVSDFVVDSATGVVFVKIPANGLTVAKIGNSGGLSVGQTLVVVFNKRHIIPVNISHIGYDFSSAGSAVLSSEGLAKEVFLDQALDSSFDGAVVVNLKGEIVGLVDSGRIIMADYFKSVVNQVLNNKSITRPILGIEYIDLAQVDGLSEKGDKGALVYGNPPQSSPAYGKLKDGDIIRKVNDMELNVYRGLAEVIFSYDSGKEIDLLVFRDGQEQTITLNLK